MARDEATLRQVAAADPARSTWVTANAGSGKTRVLTDRVARLLLQGARPDSILCLTYTKAAASEMQNRLFATLGGWAMAEDAPLTAALAALGVEPLPGAAELDAARRLFASAIETPGGLRIQTIHAFCAGLLRRFPLEAGVSPAFRELDDRSLAELIDDAVEAVGEGPGRPALDALAAELSGDDSLHEVVAGLLRHRGGFAPPLDRDGALRAMGLPPGYDAAALAAEAFDGHEAALLARLVPALEAGGPSDAKAGSRLRPLVGGPLLPGDLPVLEGVLLTGGQAAAPFSAKPGSGRGAFPTKGTAGVLDAATLDALEGLKARVEAARPRRLALAAAERTAVLHRFAAELLPEIARRKAAGGWLDFDDLILTAQRLLSDPAVADWVLWKLDGGIAHVLVDEAQDTSPDQWQVIRLLARDIGAGLGGGGVRTLFVVGDRKQSIYSFQGADPEALAGLHVDFAARIAAGGGALADGALEHSFRSAPAVLQAVDAVFDGAGGAGLGEASCHVAFHAAAPGRVDLWPEVLPEPEEDDPPEWHEPLDRRSPRHPAAVLAEAVAGEIRRLLDAGAQIPVPGAAPRPMHAGDVLILVQRRGRLFGELLRACKRQGLPLAGADRLKLLETLAVRDLLALLSFLSLQDDDLALAEALRSPLFGWSEDALYRLAQPRGGRTLWQALRDAGDTRAQESRSILDDLRRVADFLRPYDMLERILVRHGGRARLLARLGPDCEEAVDALLGLALDYESAQVPSLTGFLEWMRAEDTEVKRQAEGAGAVLRLMTVHGAKGLEAPLVILPDAADRQPGKAAQILATPDGTVWDTRADDRPPRVAAAVAAAQERLRQERLRLLYVAMTRAKSWLVVCAAGAATPDKEGWHALVRAGLDRLGAAPLASPTGADGLRWQTGDWPAPAAPAAAPAAAVAAVLPVWARKPAPAPVEPAAALAPSGLGGAKALPGESGQDEATALRRGTLLHLLLEHLPRYPEASWQAYGRLLLASAEDRPLPAEAEELLAEAVRVLTHPDLADLFGAGTLAEVDLSAALPDGRRMHGAVDRLVISPARVLAVDFKSNRLVPDRAEDTPEGILRQMGAYAAALAQIWPDRAIETAILWTRPARLMPLPATLTAAALARAEP